MRRLCFSEMFEYSVKGISLITKQPQNINKLHLVLLKVSILVNIWVSDNFKKFAMSPFWINPGNSSKLLTRYFR